MTGPAGIYWQLPILVVVISLVYSATRYDQWGPILRETIRWIFQVAAFMGGVGIVLYVLAEFIV